MGKMCERQFACVNGISLILTNHIELFVYETASNKKDFNDTCGVIKYAL